MSEITSPTQEIKNLEEENEKLKKIIEAMASKERLYSPTLGDLIDRLVICQLKELLIKEHRDKYSAEIREILHDVDLTIKESDVKLDANLIRDIIILTIMNREIWLNEANWRKGIREGNNLELSHGINSLRCKSKNRIQERVGGRKDHKLDNVEAFPEWIPSGYEK